MSNTKTINNAPIDHGKLVDVNLFPHVILSPDNTVIKIKSTITNFKALIDFYGILLRTNMVSKDMEIIIPWKKDADLNTASTEIISQCNLNLFPKGNIRVFIASLAGDNKYDP